MSIDVRIKYHADIVKPLEPKPGNEWIDLKVAEDVFLSKGESGIVSFGVSIALPDGYEAIVVPRSSTYARYRVIQTNHLGVIDNRFCGNNDVWKWSIQADDHVFIPAGARVAQFRIQKVQPEIKFVEAETLGLEDRGGWGSTGI